MAINVSNTSLDSFGTFDASATVTHVRVKNGAQILVTIQLGTSRLIGANVEAQIDAGDLDLKFNSGPFVDAGIQSLISAEINTGLVIEMLTAVNTEVSVGGYSEQTITDWTYATIGDD